MTVQCRAMEKLAKQNFTVDNGGSLHILFVSAYWHYPEVMLEFVDKVRKKGHKVSVFLGDPQGKLDPKYLDGDVDFYFPSKLDSLSRITGTPYPVFRDVKSCLRRLRPDVVHINSHLFLSNYQVARAARSLRFPFVVTVHGFMVRRGLVIDMLQEVYLRSVARLLFNMASEVICLTAAEAENVAEVMGGYDKISVIPNGVDVDFFKPSEEKDSNLIAWIGRFVPEKGLVYLLEAMREVVKQSADVKLVLGGDGPLRNDLWNFVNRFGLRKNIVFLGALNHVEVASILSKSSIFVFPSLKEGMPRALLETMACGAAVIGSNVSGIKDIIRHERNGILVPPRDPVALANAILTLLRDENLRRFLGQNARELMIKKYNWDKVTDKLEDVYYEAVAKAN
jgi:glycosyltransferase involved in cell wall biosynthesis